VLFEKSESEYERYVIGWALAFLLAVMVVTGGCPPPRQRDKDQQTGMGPRDEAAVFIAD
jgi:hypothetical protein